jgi:tRNA 2-thiouridine synthesizing protein A
MVERISVADVLELDVIGENCPMPLLKAKRALNAMEKGQHLKVLATDRGSVRDFQVFAQQSGNILLSSQEEDGVYIHLLMKG